MKADFVVDAGNTAIKWGRVANGAIVEMAYLSPNNPSTWQEQGKVWKVGSSRSWVLAGSNAAHRERMAGWLTDYDQQVHVLHSGPELPLRINVKYPEKVGLDRLLNAVAVNSRRTPGNAAAIIDAGTAATVDYVDGQGVFQGGAILPGLGLMARALHLHTAALPLLSLEELHQATSLKLPGKSTSEAMTLGIFTALLGGVEKIATAYYEQAKGRIEYYFAGGEGNLLMECLPYDPPFFWPEMTLEGIRIAAEHLP